MMRRAVGFACLLAGFCACRYDPLTENCPAENKTRVGDRFMVNLPEEHRSGYLWQLAPGHDMTKIMQLNTAWHGDEKGVDFNFEAIDTGATTLTFFKRKFTDTTELRCFRVRITPY